MATKISRILGPDGQPITYDVLEEEISRGGMTGIRQVWTGSVANNLTPQRLATVLSGATDGSPEDYLTLAEEMEERDMHYASVLGTRRLALAGLEIRVDAYSDAAEDVKLADAIRELVADPMFYEAVFDLTDAFGKGYAAAEIVWDRTAKPWRPVKIIHRDPRFFRYDRETGQELRLLDDSAPVDGLALPPYKFIVHQPRIRTGLPIRGGLARLAAPAYMCKAWSWKDWMAFADVFGMPMRVGTYGQNASDGEIAKLMSAVANLGSDAAAVIAEGTKIEFQAAPNTAGAADFFERLANFWDKQVSKGILGQTMTADDGSSMSQAKVHNEVRGDLLKADAKALQATLNRDLIRPFVDLNYGHGRYPTLVVPVPDDEDLKLMLDALERLVPMGLEVEQSVVRDKFGIPDPAEGKGVKLLRAPDRPAAVDVAPPAVKAPELPPAKVVPIQRARNDEMPPQPAPEYLDGVLAQVAVRADGITEGWMQQIRERVMNCESYDELLLRLGELQSELDINDLGDLLADASALANRAGIDDASGEGGDVHA